MSWTNRSKREVTVLPLLNHRIAAWSLAVFSLTTVSATAGLLPERVENAGQERIAAGTYQTLLSVVVDGDQSEVVVSENLTTARRPTATRFMKSVR
jgi:serine-type D-Ala-D-Ala carboxypeptidase/endopeptidase